MKTTIHISSAGKVKKVAKIRIFGSDFGENFQKRFTMSAMVNLVRTEAIFKSISQPKKIIFRRRRWEKSVKFLNGVDTAPHIMLKITAKVDLMSTENKSLILNIENVVGENLILPLTNE